MSRKFKRCFAVGCLLAAYWMRSRPLNAETVGQMPRFTVRLYNYAQVGPVTLAKAKAAASDVFRKAGIELIWLDCPVAPGDVEKKAACGRVDGMLWVQLNILPEKMAKRNGDPNEVFGTAFGSQALVYFHRVRERCGQDRFSESLVLGHVIAHELGHLVLGPGNHTPTGVMKVRLTRADLRVVLQGYLVFDSKQAARMQAHLRQLAEAASSAPPGDSASAPACADVSLR